MKKHGDLGQAGTSQNGAGDVPFITTRVLLSRYPPMQTGLIPCGVSRQEKLT